MDRNESVPRQTAPAPAGFRISQPQPITVRIFTFGTGPMDMKCPCCEANITTEIVKTIGIKTHVIAILLCLFGCWPCAPCPYCIDSCLLTNHYCPECKVCLGRYET